MDLKKPELSESELQTLCAFISRKGFGEPALLLEILDHFACKVEELSAQHPDWPLEKRMEEAHRQFGVAGFYPLVKNYEEGLQRHYSRYFRKSLAAGFGDARTLGLVLLAPLLFYIVTLLTFPLWQQLTGNLSYAPAAWIAFLAFAVIDIIQIRRFPKRSHVFMRAAQSSWYSSLFLPSIYFVFIPLSEHVPLPVLLGLSAAYVLFQQARYATFRQARHDYEEKVAGFKPVAG